MNAAILAILTGVVFFVLAVIANYQEKQKKHLK